LNCPAGTSLSGNGIVECKSGGKFEGDVGSCAAGTCGAPVKSSNMASTSCQGSTVESGTTCTPTCADGYEATGTFKCNNGVYVETAICRAEGAPAATKVYYVEGKIQVTIKLPAGKTVEDLKNDQSFMNTLKESIAAGLDGVNPADVEVIIESRRRLLEDGAPEARRLQEAQLNVRYKIKTANKAAATALSNQITNNKGAFEDSFKKTMKEKANVEVTGMVTESPAVAEGYVDPATTSTGGTAGGDDEGGSNTGAIVGGIIGAIAGVALLAAIFMFYSKKTGSQE
jgi:hypothetical protein